MLPIIGLLWAPGGRGGCIGCGDGVEGEFNPVADPRLYFCGGPRLVPKFNLIPNSLLVTCPRQDATMTR